MHSQLLHDHHRRGPINHYHHARLQQVKCHAVKTPCCCLVGHHSESVAQDQSETVESCPRVHYTANHETVTLDSRVHEHEPRSWTTTPFHARSQSQEHREEISFKVESTPRNPPYLENDNNNRLCASVSCTNHSCVRWQTAPNPASGRDCYSPCRMDNSRPASAALTTYSSSRSPTPPREQYCGPSGQWAMHRRDSNISLASSFSEDAAASSFASISTPAVGAANDALPCCEMHPDFMSNMRLIANVATTSEKMSIDRLLNPSTTSPTADVFPCQGEEDKSKEKEHQRYPLFRGTLQQRAMSELERLYNEQHFHNHHHIRNHPYERPNTKRSIGSLTLAKTSMTRVPYSSCSSPPSPPPSTSKYTPPQSSKRRDPHDTRVRREKRAWDPVEIQLLLRCVIEAKSGGAKWRRVADLMKNGRTPTSCANKYKRMKHSREPSAYVTEHSDDSGCGRGDGGGGDNEPLDDNSESDEN
ncbi:hypothetical protein BG004_001402 [Podila humilis]|nr:hypothetical protein BG004_001402 [Podila humilis]